LTILTAYFGLEATNILLTKSVVADLKDNGGRTPLSYAAESGHYATVKLLLATNGVDAHSEDDDGMTPLYWASWNGHKAVVKLLQAT
jgi:ankyrin repeat protein